MAFSRKSLDFSRERSPIFRGKRLLHPPEVASELSPGNDGFIDFALILHSPHTHYRVLKKSSSQPDYGVVRYDTHER